MIPDGRISRIRFEAAAIVLEQQFEVIVLQFEFEAQRAMRCLPCSIVGIYAVGCAPVPRAGYPNG